MLAHHPKQVRWESFVLTGKDVAADRRIKNSTQRVYKTAPTGRDIPAQGKTRSVAALGQSPNNYFPFPIRDARARRRASIADGESAQTLNAACSRRSSIMLAHHPKQVSWESFILAGQDVPASSQKLAFDGTMALGAGQRRDWLLRKLSGLAYSSNGIPFTNMAQAWRTASAKQNNAFRPIGLALGQRSMTIICNTSSLCCLTLLGHAEILPALLKQLQQFHSIALEVRIASWLTV